MQGFLKGVYVAGFVLNILLLFVPLKLEPGVSHTSIEIVRLLFRSGQFGIASFYVGVIIAMAAFIVLAFTYPRRIVFILGAAFSSIMILAGLILGDDLQVAVIAGYLASGMSISGFFVKDQTRDKYVAGA